MLINESSKIVVRIERVFAQALVDESKQTLFDILSDDGVFTIQETNLDTQEVDKQTFIDWILSKRKVLESLNYNFDQCTFCRIGNPVCIFNDGSFPKQPKDDSEKVKTGLMFVTNDNMIEEIRFCYSFISTDNGCGFETKRDKLIHGCMSQMGLTREEAEKKLDEEKAKRLQLDLTDLDDVTRRILKEVYPDLNL